MAAQPEPKLPSRDSGGWQTQSNHTKCFFSAQARGLSLSVGVLALTEARVGNPAQRSLARAASCAGVLVVWFPRPSSATFGGAGIFARQPLAARQTKSPALQYWADLRRLAIFNVIGSACDCLVLALYAYSPSNADVGLSDSLLAQAFAWARGWAGPIMILVHRIAALCVVRCVGHLALPVATSLRCNFWQISCCFVQ